MILIKSSLQANAGKYSLCSFSVLFFANVLTPAESLQMACEFRITLVAILPTFALVWLELPLQLKK
jgi:hypothetical protein